jgi:hypothetical protein
MECPLLVSRLFLVRADVLPQPPPNARIQSRPIMRLDPAAQEENLALSHDFVALPNWQMSVFLSAYGGLVVAHCLTDCWFRPVLRPFSRMFGMNWVWHERCNVVDNKPCV